PGKCADAIAVEPAAAVEVANYRERFVAVRMLGEIEIDSLLRVIVAGVRPIENDLHVVPRRGRLGGLAQGRDVLGFGEGGGDEAEEEQANELHAEAKPRGAAIFGDFKKVFV